MRTILDCDLFIVKAVSLLIVRFHVRLTSYTTRQLGICCSHFNPIQYLGRCLTTVSLAAIEQSFGGVSSAMARRWLTVQEVTD